MLTTNTIQRYSIVLQLISFLKCVPYKWNGKTLRMENSSGYSLFGWNLVVGFSLWHMTFVTCSFFISWRFQLTSQLQLTLQVLWAICFVLEAGVHLNVVLNRDELLSFFNQLVLLAETNSGTRHSDWARKQEKNLLIYLLGFVLLSLFVNSPSVPVLFLLDPTKHIFLFSIVPKQYQDSWTLLTLFGLYELTKVIFLWFLFHFFIFLQLGFFYSCRTALKEFRSAFQSQSFSPMDAVWMISYRKLQLLQRMFNNCMASVLMPLSSVLLIASVLTSNYGTIRFLQSIHRESRPSPGYLIFPCLSVTVITYQLIFYTLTGSINSLSLGYKYKATGMKNKSKLQKKVCSMYLKSFAPLKVQIGSFRFISKFTVVTVVSFLLIGTSRICILISVED